MFPSSFDRRGALALALSFVLAACAQAKPADEAPAPEIPRMDPDHCQGQPILQPLEPLTILTRQGPARFRVEMADTAVKREYGLMCRTTLAPNRGMLFDFKEPSDNVAFWMRNTLIGLDIVYIAPSGRVLSVARNAAPLDETPIPAGGTIRAVLEIPARRADQLGIQPGDRVEQRIFGR